MLMACTAGDDADGAEELGTGGAAPAFAREAFKDDKSWANIVGIKIKLLGKGLQGIGTFQYEWMSKVGRD